MKDPLVAVLTTAMEQICARGVIVSPAGDGWLIRVAPTDILPDPPERRTHEDEFLGSLSDSAQVRRAW